MICGHVRIEDGANLKDCYIGANYTVIKDGKGCVHVYMTHSHIYLYTHTHTLSADLRGETLVAGGGLHI